MAGYSLERVAGTSQFGLFNTLSYPHYASIIFTDSIPLFAVIFKALSGILPDTFQYFGIYGIISYILQGVFAFTLLRKFIKNKYYAMAGTIFFIISPYMLQRMFAHTALAGNFIILMAMSIFAYREKYKNRPIKKILLWSLLLGLASTIHLYYVPMVVIIMFSAFIVEFIENKKTIKSSIIAFTVSCLLALMLIFLLGGFSSENEHANIGDLGNFTINLNTFINPQGYSRILQNLNTATEGEGEGFGYLGVGILLMLVISVILIIKNNNKKEILEKIKNPNTIFILLCTTISIIIAMGTSIKLNSHIICNIPYPSFIIKILEIFRASGRFIWIACYCIFFGSIYTVYKYESKKIFNIIITICLLLQIFDLRSALINKFEYTKTNTYEQNAEEFKKALGNCEHIICLEFNSLGSSEYFELAYIASKNDCTINNFYFAREIKNAIKTRKRISKKYAK